MILVTIGSAPHDFSRLVCAVDELAEKLGLEVVMQIGESKYQPRHAEFFDYVPYEKMVQLYERAAVVIGHGSSGPMIHAAKFNKPLIIFPRSGNRGEHLDNHQMETAKAISSHYPDVQVIYEVEELEPALRKAMEKSEQPLAEKSLGGERGKLISALRCFTQSTGKDQAFQRPFFLMRLLKQFLISIKIYSILSSVKNGTWKYLQKGYSPKAFWQKWGDDFYSQKFRHGIGPSHLWLLQQMEIHRPSQTLEVGCAFARTLHYLERKMPQVKFVGIDLSEPMLVRAAKEPGAANLICASAQKLPFKNKSFDWIYTHGTLMHVLPKDLEGCLHEFERVTKRGIFLVEETFWKKNPEASGALNLNPYTFVYDYSSVLRKLGWHIESEVVMQEGVALLVCLVALPPSAAQTESLRKEN